MCNTMQSTREGLATVLIWIAFYCTFCSQSQCNKHSIEGFVSRWICRDGKNKKGKASLLLPRLFFLASINFKWNSQNEW